MSFAQDKCIGNVKFMHDRNKAEIATAPGFKCNIVDPAGFAHRVTDRKLAMKFHPATSPHTPLIGNFRQKPTQLWMTVCAQLIGGNHIRGQTPKQAGWHRLISKAMRCQTLLKMLNHTRRDAVMPGDAVANPTGKIHYHFPFIHRLIIVWCQPMTADAAPCRRQISCQLPPCYPIFHWPWRHQAARLLWPQGGFAES